MANALPGPFENTGADGNSHAFVSFKLAGKNLHSIPFDHMTKADIEMSATNAEISLTLSDASFTDVFDVLAVETSKIKKQNEIKTKKISDIQELGEEYKKGFGSLFTFQFGWKYPLWKYPELTGFVLQDVDTSISTSAVKYDFKFLPLTNINLTEIKQNTIQIGSTQTIFFVIQKLLKSIGITDIEYIPDASSGEFKIINKEEGTRSSSLARPVGEIGTVADTTVFEFLIAHVIPKIQTNDSQGKNVHFNLYVNYETNPPSAKIMREDLIGKYSNLKSVNPKSGRKFKSIGTAQNAGSADVKVSEEGGAFREGVFSLRYGRGADSVIKSRIISFDAGKISLLPYLYGIKARKLDKDTGEEVTSEDVSSPVTVAPPKAKSVNYEILKDVDFDEKSYMKRVESIMEAYSTRTLSNTINIEIFGNPSFTYTQVMRKYIDVNIILPNGIRHFISGKYMIVGIAHHLELGKYTTKIECQKVGTRSGTTTK